MEASLELDGRFRHGQVLRTGSTLCASDAKASAAVDWPPLLTRDIDVRESAGPVLDCQGQVEESLHGACVH